MFTQLRDAIFIMVSTVDLYLCLGSISARRAHDRASGPVGAGAYDEEGRVVVHPWSATPSGRGRDINLPPGNTQTRPMKAEDRTRIPKAIATGRAWMDELATVAMPSPAAIVSRDTLT